MKGLHYETHYSGSSCRRGWIGAEIPALPGCISEGETVLEILMNIREAAEGWMTVATERAVTDTDAQVVELEL